MKSKKIITTVQLIQNLTTALTLNVPYPELNRFILSNLFDVDFESIKNAKSYDLPTFIPALSSRDYIVIDVLIETLVGGNSTEFERFLNVSNDLDNIKIEYIKTAIPWPIISKTNYDESLIVLNKILEHATNSNS